MATLSRPWEWARRKLYRARLPQDMRHMRAAHPDFALRAGGDDAYEILWRHRVVGRTHSLATLRQPRAPDCFIMGTGPSVNECDLSRLRGLDCIGVNGSILKSDEYGLSFRSHVIADRNFFLDRFELVKRVLASGAECLFSFRGLSVICERDSALLASATIFLLDEVAARYGQPKMAPDEFDRHAEADPDLLLHPHRRPSKGWVGFSRDIRKGVFTGQTIVFSALQVAVWLGYRRIFIIGMDLGGTGFNQRFYESGAQAASMRLDRDYDRYIVPAFEVARDALAQQGVAVYNLSEHSRLPDSVIPKLSFADAVADAGASVGGDVPVSR